MVWVATVASSGCPNPAGYAWRALPNTWSVETAIDDRKDVKGKGGGERRGGRGKGGKEKGGKKGRRKKREKEREEKEKERKRRGGRGEEGKEEVTGRTRAGKEGGV